MIEFLIGLAILIAVTLFGRALVACIDLVEGRGTPVENIGDWLACFALGFVISLLSILLYLIGRMVREGCG